MTYFTTMPQFENCMTYSALQCQIKFTLASRNLLFHNPYAKVFAFIFVHVFGKGTEYVLYQEQVVRSAIG